MYGLQDIIGAAGGLINKLTVISIALAILVFFWGIVKYIFQSDNEKEKGIGKSFMVWGVVALTVMVSVWGIIEFFQLDLDLTNNTL